ncbi:MAG: alginate O-acetyltransferase AlgX-related protein [bacterium]
MTGAALRRAAAGLAANLALLVAALLAAAVIGEIALRAIYNAPLHRGRRMFVFYQHDPILGWRTKPNARGMYVKDEFAAFLEFNSRGARGPEHAATKAAGAFRILVLGDSFAEGYTVEFAHLFSELMSREIASSTGRTCESINCGTTGYSTDQELLLFRETCAAYNPDLTVLLVFDNDVWHNAQAESYERAKPLFRVDADSLVLTNTPIPAPASWATQGPGQGAGALVAPRAWGARLKARLGDESYLYNRVRTALQTLRSTRRAGRPARDDAPREDAALDEAGAGAAAIDEIPGEFRLYETEARADVSHAWRLTDAILATLARETRAAGSELLVFYVPRGERIRPEHWRATERRYGISRDAWDLSRVAAGLREICARNGIHFIDPTERFVEEDAAARKKGERLYYAQDGHWTARGHALAGRLLAAEVAASYLGADLVGPPLR